MRTTLLHRLLFSLLLGSFVLASWEPGRPQAQSDASKREQAYRANNVGVALLEQFKHKEGADQFRRALQIDATLAVARINLAIALYNVPELDAALREAKAAAGLLPNAPQPHYMLGLIAKAQNRPEEALASFQRVLQIDSRDVGAKVNVGQIYLNQRKYVEAMPMLRAALETEPYNTTAAYSLGLALSRGGQREEGLRVFERFKIVSDGGYGTSFGTNYLEQGQYAEALSSTGAEPDLVDPKPPDVAFADATASMMPPGPTKAPGVGVTPIFSRSFSGASLNDAARQEIVAAFGGSAALFDYDGDGDLDLFEAVGSAQRLYRNDGGKFAEVTAQSGLSDRVNGSATGVVAGDYDNDTKPDLFVLRYGAGALYHNDGNGKFSDVTAAAGIPAYPYLSISAALVDVDHDGDLDLFIAGFIDLAKSLSADSAGRFPIDFPGAPNLLLRNNGNGKFTDTTAAAKLTGSMARAVAVVPTDYDNRREIDLLILNFNAAPNLLRNMRDGSFTDIAAVVGLGNGAFTSAAAGDFNKDGFTDFYFGASGSAGSMAVSDGKGRFALQPAPAAASSSPLAESDAAQLLDYDDDGLLDLVRVSMSEGGGGLRLLRNAGQWTEVPATRDVLPKLAPRVLVSGDLDGDGDTDVVVRAASGELRVLRNEGGSRNRSLRVQLAGKVSNRGGVGSKVEARAGSLRQKFETYAASPAPAPADIIFGMGQRTAVDAVRVIWPAGIVQAETEIAKTAPNQLAQTLVVTELDRKPSSCPYLYTWNGERFEFITDFMGGGEMGYWMAPGIRNHPDPDEYVRIRDDQLKARGRRYEIRVTNELEETVYVDRLQLIAVAHPADVQVYPNEGMVDPPLPPFKLYTTRNVRPPIVATDDHGCNVLSRIARMDRQYADDFRLLQIRGYAEEHTLTLDLGKESTGRSLLLMTAWTDYAFSSDNVAAHQAGLSMMPPALQVKDAQGRWKTVIADIGIPVGRPQTIAVDLAGKFLSDSREVRIVTNMRIYWDQILVADSDAGARVQMARLDPLKAELRWRGFSAETTPDGREPFGYDYDRVSASSPWKTMSGRYTREGDVKELVVRTDDMFVISRPGDEIAVSFDAKRLPALRRGWKRTFLLYADGFSKEMDINSASPHQVMPLPFHGMSGYPYSTREKYPMTRARREYIERYNTRVVRAPIRRELAGSGD
jgi:tetratricopeptide (TPR) repeat protein